jgi:hypothetical protein
LIDFIEFKSNQNSLIKDNKSKKFYGVGLKSNNPPQKNPCFEGGQGGCKMCKNKTINTKS